MTTGGAGAQERHEGARTRESASYHVLESNRNTRGGEFFEIR